jgi:hypothetical protein
MTKQVLVAVRQGTWPTEPEARMPIAEEPGQTDLSTSGWWTAERRRLGLPSVPSGAVTSASDNLAGATGLVMPGTGPEARPSPAIPAGAASRRRRGRTTLTRLWAVLKVASLAYTTWWAMGYLRASLGTSLSAYGAVSLFAGFGARWRKRFFGPGQLIEPELYEEAGRWLYRLGVALVLIGGVVVSAQYASH